VSDKEDRGLPSGAKIVGGLLKKAATLGAATYVTAEDTFQKTMNTVQLPKEMIFETIEEFFKRYTLQIQAEISLKPRAEKKE
jgi:hypothetical protein